MMAKKTSHFWRQWRTITLGELTNLEKDGLYETDANLPGSRD